MAYYMRKMTDDVSVYDPTKAFNGYTFFATYLGKDAWLVDMKGRICKHWEFKYPCACHGKLLPNGHVMWQQKGPGTDAHFAGAASELVEVDWDGHEVWRYEDPRLNHDFYPMENGNVLTNSWVEIPPKVAEKIQGGIPGTENDGGMILSGVLREVNRAGEVVWEWKHYEHLDLENDIICPLCPRSIWGYTNSVYVLPDGNILVTLRFLNTLIIVEKGSGNIIWRWGPEYALGHPHCASYLENGHILVFDNGLHRYSPEVGVNQAQGSRVVEVNPKTNEVVWEYMDQDQCRFYTAITGGTERLANGNTLIVESVQGRIFEVTKEKEIVWEYISPFSVYRPPYWGWEIHRTIFQAQRFAPDFPGLQGRNLNPDLYEWVIQEKSQGDIAEINLLKRLEALGY